MREPLDARSDVQRAASGPGRALDAGGHGHIHGVPVSTSVGELFRLQRSAGNRAVARSLIAATGRTKQSAVRSVQQQATPNPAGPMTRDRFVETLRSRYGIGLVRAGTFAEQEKINNQPNVAPAGRLTQAAWRPWDPGASSGIYESILESFADFESSLGGIPPVDGLLFFDTAFMIDATTHAVVPDASVGAEFGAGRMDVYRSGIAGSMGTRRGIPVGRSLSTGQYPLVVASMHGRGTDPGAPIPLPSAAENTGRIITHELGHGLAEQAMAADPAMFTQYRLAVGWVNNQLFDVGIPEVRDALAAGNPPPPTVQVRRGGRQVSQRTQITPDDWNNPQWIEQPVSGYSVSNGAGEDFAEAVMAFINSRSVLAARSPVRMQFLESRRASWLPFLRVRPPVGDFPTPSRAERVA